MAFFDKLFNYNSPGPGVDKNAPKKTGFALFWDIFREKFWNLIPLSLLYIVLCLPVITIGFADVGLTYVTRNFVREKPTFIFAEFFSAIKKNWKQALLIGIVNLVITSILLFAMVFYFMYWKTTFLFKIGFVIAGCIFIVFSFLKYYINMLIITFKLSVKQIYRNSLLLSSVGLKENLIISAAVLGLYAVLFGVPMLWLYIFEDATLTLVFGFLAVLFLPALQSLIIQFCVFPVIKKHMIDPYYEAHPDEAKKGKALLNLNDNEESDGEEALFIDRGSNEIRPTPVESTIPKQYSKRDMKRLRSTKDIDDDTI